MASAKLRDDQETKRKNRWVTAELVARGLTRAGIDWAVLNGVDSDRQLVGRDVDLWIQEQHISDAVAVTSRLLVRAGWPSVWHRHINMVHQVIGFDLSAMGPVTIAFDLIGDTDWWSTRGIGLYCESMLLKRNQVGPFMFSPDGRAIKTRLMPFLRGDHSKFLDDGERLLRRSDFEPLVHWGFIPAPVLEDWLRCHSVVFGGETREHHRQDPQHVRKAASDLRHRLWRASRHKRLKAIRTYARKTTLYGLSAVGFPPVSLSLGKDCAAAYEELATITQGTFIDLIHSSGTLRRTFPKKPASGIAVHVSPGRMPGIRLRTNAWGSWWKIRLMGKRLPVSSATGAVALLETVRWVYDELQSVPR